MALQCVQQVHVVTVGGELADVHHLVTRRVRKLIPGEDVLLYSIIILCPKLSQVYVWFDVQHATFCSISLVHVEKKATQCVPVWRAVWYYFPCNLALLCSNSFHSNLHVLVGLFSIQYYISV